MMTVLGPNLQLVWTKVNETALAVSKKCSTQLGWLTDNLPGFIEWVSYRLPAYWLRSRCVSKTGSAQNGVFEEENG